MHGNNPTRDSIENAFANAVTRSQIKAWERLPGYGPHAKWRVTLNPGAVGPQGGGDMDIRTYQEAKLVAAALASAHFGVPLGTPDVSDLVDAQRRGVLSDASFVAAVHRRHQAADAAAALDPCPPSEAAERGILLHAGQLREWAGLERDLTPDELDALDECIPNSSIPDAIGTIVTEALGLE